jgi:hypothetical protein
MLGAASLLLLVAVAKAEDTVIQTSLQGRVESKRIVAGSSIFVKVVADWKEGRCRLHEGDTLEARVVTVEHHTPANTHERIELRFLPLTCAGDESREIVPILVAIEPKPDESDTSVLDRSALMSAFTAMVRAQGAGQQNAGSRSMSAAPLGEHSLRIGDVLGFPGVMLELPTLTLEPTAILSSRDILFDSEVEFILVMRTVSSQPSTINMANLPSLLPGEKASSAHARLQQPVEVESCVESGCKLADLPALHTGGQLERQLSLTSLGYKPRNNRVLFALGEDAAVRFLGEDELLITFDIHPLIPRSREDKQPQATPRLIRALLVSVHDGKVLHAEDWHVRENGPYLWPLGDGQVLAAVGETLVILGPDLRPERQWTLSGPLALVRVSPSRNLIVAAVVKERHTPDRHHRPSELMGAGHDMADEDYELTVLDGQLRVIGTKQLHAPPDIPAVLDSGLLVSEAASQSRWTLQETKWDGTQHAVAAVLSPCPLRIKTLPTNLILMIGCSPDGAHSWYKIIRKDGKTLLKGDTASNAWLENAEALTAKDLFAIGIVEAARPVDFQEGMSASEFKKLAVSVYSSKTGERLYAAPSIGGSVDRQSFALSQDGDRLAVLSDGNVSLYKTGMTPQAVGAQASSR